MPAGVKTPPKTDDPALRILFVLPVTLVFTPAPLRSATFVLLVTLVFTPAPLRSATFVLLVTLVFIPAPPRQSQIYNLKSTISEGGFPRPLLSVCVVIRPCATDRPGPRSRTRRT